MSRFLEDLAARRRFGMKPGLGTIRSVLGGLGNPERRFKTIHVAGTNGKGAVCAILDAALRTAGERSVGRYTSPHLVRINERFFLDGEPMDDARLEAASETVARASDGIADLTFFEALTAVAFFAYADANASRVVMECGLGGRLDATNACHPELSVITRIGLDHCDWLGDTVGKIATEKAGIVRPGVPVVLGRNVPSVVETVRAAAREKGAPFFYAPDLADESEIPADFSLAGSFNRENAVTALAALHVLGISGFSLSQIVWPGRFQRVGRFLVDGAHNPPAARALADALNETGMRDLTLVCGFCADKDVDEVLRLIRPYVARALAVRTNNPRSLPAEETARRLRAAGIPSEPCPSLAAALASAAAQAQAQPQPRPQHPVPPSVLVCGSLFLAGEALVELGAYPWPTDRFDVSESLRPQRTTARDVV